jgi:predicted anti-sigma-YlaC factor YlaD
MSSVAFHDPLCERARAFVSLRLDGDLPELEDALLDAHLSRCARCQEFAASVEGMTAELRAGLPELPTAPIAVPRRRYTAARGLRVGAAAAVLALSVVLAGALRSGQTTVATPAASLVRSGSEVQDLRAWIRASRAGHARFSSAYLRSLRLPGDS